MYRVRRAYRPTLGHFHSTPVLIFRQNFLGFEVTHDAFLSTTSAELQIVEHIFYNPFPALHTFKAQEFHIGLLYFVNDFRNEKVREPFMDDSLP